MTRTPISRKKASIITTTNPRQKSLKRSAEHARAAQRRRVLAAKKVLPWQALVDWKKITELSPKNIQRLTVVASLLIVIGLVLSIYSWLLKPTNLTIKQVDIQGQFHYINPEQLGVQIKPYTDTNLFLLDEVGLEQFLEQQSWIRAASLRKIWPNRLEILLEEQVPVAFWGKDQLLNQYGEIFTGNLLEKQGIFPYLYSPSENGRELAERYVELTRLLSNLSLEISELTEDAAGSWAIRFKDGPEVIIGRKDYEKRLSRLKVGYVQALKDKFSQIRSIDLRYTNGFAVEWKQIPTSFLGSDISKRIGS
ncbi:cell division protein FtsQ/DivIB [Thiofilum flexile]|uniref:cell division protein FtsQ/DivIB n=1 Tax=Thiofilum flexile TaxID=125627 RepID=UPI0003746191|nr:cell division protein FtsQ/DivIB [Thiofilum flexile]